MDAEAAKREDRDLFILPKTMNVEATKLSILRVHLSGSLFQISVPASTNLYFDRASSL